MKTFRKQSAEKTSRMPHRRAVGASFIALSAFAIFTASLQEAHAAASLYDEMLNATRSELFLNDKSELAPEPEILEPIEKWLPYVENPNPGDTDEMRDFLGGGFEICERDGLDIVSECEGARIAAWQLVAREQRTRTLGRDLQIIASSFEEPLLGGFSLPFMSRVHGIAGMWQADIAAQAKRDDPLSEPGRPRVRMENIPENPEIEDAFRALNDALASLDGGDEISAAVGRHRFAGARWMRGKLADFPPPSEEFIAPAPGGERELIQRRFPDVENALESLADALIADESHAPDKGEVVVALPPKSLQDILPENVLAWAYIERLRDGSLSGDAGLQWAHPIEPAPLTLCGNGGAYEEGGGDENDENEKTSCEPVPGGMYPPPPRKEARPLCIYPLMRAGLLCSPQPPGKGDDCAEHVAASRDEIQLSGCSGGEAARETEEGGDACEGTEWQAEEADDDDVCTPARKTSFRNTIGNATCFINRCWKQSFEDHRVIPGRTPLTAGDTAFPFDVCMREDRQLGKIILAMSGEQGWSPPPYRPAFLLRKLEEAICPGLPLGSPLCAFDPARRMTLPLTEPMKFGEDLVGQAMEFLEPKLALQQLGETIGIRIGTRLYGDFLSKKTARLAEFTAAAASLLSQFTRVEFPSVLCPMNDAGGDGLLDTPMCGADAKSGPAEDSVPDGDSEPLALESAPDSNNGEWNWEFIPDSYFSP